MTPDQIRAAINADPARVALAQAGNTQAIADALSVGRTRPNAVQIGHGTILETIGLAAGNAVLDAITAAPDYRYVKPLLEQGRLIASSPLVAGAVQDLVAGGVLTEAQGAALVALGREPDPVTHTQVGEAIRGGL